MAVSYYAKCKPKRGKGYIAIYVNIDSEIAHFFIGISIELSDWDSNLRLVKKGANRYLDHNMIIQAMLARATEIFTKATLKGRPVCMDEFSEQFKAVRVGENIHLLFGKAFAAEEGRMEASTLRQQRSSLKKFETFQPNLNVLDLTPVVLRDFDRWMELTLGNDVNTRATAMKNVKKYFRIIASGYEVEDPFKVFKIKRVSPDRTFLTQTDLSKLMDCYLGDSLNEAFRDVAEMFLFSCFTGLRISDAKRVNMNFLVEGKLEYLPKKTKRKRQKIVIPLSGIALKFLQKAGSKSFSKKADQVVNRQLKSIASAAGINKRLSFHVARHTFASLYLKMGGNVQVLQRILGHTDIKTTMIYVHIGEDQMLQEMQNFDKLGLSMQAV